MARKRAALSAILIEVKNFLFIFSSQKNQKRSSFGLTLDNKKGKLTKILEQFCFHLLLKKKFMNRS